MTIGIDTAHLHFFRKNGKIEFENLLSTSDIQALEDAFKKRINKETLTAPFPLKFGFDLFRESDELKKLISGQKFAKLMAQLLERSKIRFGFSQYLSRNCYDNAFAYQHRLSCVRQFVGGLCLCLNPSENPENPYFPKERGSGTFFVIDEDFYLKFPKTAGEYLFILYTDERAFFSHSENDPLNIYFRTLGYEHGDRLNEDLHPSYSWMVL